MLSIVQPTEYDPRECGARCGQCPLGNSGKPSSKMVAPPVGAHRKSLAIVSDRPKASDVRGKRLYSGQTGILLDRMLEKAGAGVGDMHYTAAVLCPMPFDIEPEDARKAVAACRPRLALELASVSTVIAGGKRAAWSLTGHDSIDAWQGSFYDPAPEYLAEEPDSAEAKQVLITWDPSHSFKSPPHVPIITTHIQRAVQQAQGILRPWPWKWPQKFAVGFQDPNLLPYMGEILKTPAGELVSVDVEYAGKLPRIAPMLCIGFANATHAVSFPWADALLRHFGEDDKHLITVQAWEASTERGSVEWRLIQLMKRILRTKPLTGHNLHTADLPNCKAHGLPFEHIAFDSMFAQAIITPALRKRLNDCMGYEFHSERWKDIFRAPTDDGQGNRFVRSWRADPFAVMVYNAKDNTAQRILADRQRWRLENEVYNGLALLETRLRLGDIGYRMSDAGVRVDSDAMERHSVNLKQLVASIDSDLEQVAFRQASARPEYAERILSAKHMAKGQPAFKATRGSQLAALFESLDAPPVYKKGKDAPSYDKETMLAYASGDNSELSRIAYTVAKRRKYDKLEGTYIRGTRRVMINGYVHPKWNSVGAKTGRWGCNDPNLMQVPGEGVLSIPGRDPVFVPGMRDIYIPEPGWVLFKADYSQLELRIIALLAGETWLIEAFAESDVTLPDAPCRCGGPEPAKKCHSDIHRVNAGRLLGKEPWQVSGPERDLTKRAIYGTNYLGQAVELYKRLSPDYPKLTLRAVEMFQSKWFKLCAQIHKYLKDAYFTACERGYVEVPLSGRRIYFYGNVEPSKVANIPVQGTGADVIDQALLRIDKRINWTDAKVKMQIHDEIIMSAMEEHWEHYSQLQCEEMSRPVTLNGHTIAFPVEPKVGRVWSGLMPIAKWKEQEQVK